MSFLPRRLPEDVLVNIALFANASLDVRTAMGLDKKNIRWLLHPTPAFARMLEERIIKPRLSRIQLEPTMNYTIPVFFYNHKERRLIMFKFETDNTLTALVIFHGGHGVEMRGESLWIGGGFLGKTRLMCLNERHEVTYSKEYSREEAFTYSSRVFWRDVCKAGELFIHVVFRALRLYFDTRQDGNMYLRPVLRDVILSTHVKEDAGHAYYLSAADARMFIQ